MSTTAGDEVVSGVDLLESVRTWIAYALTVVLPGAGHLYVGQWKRGLAWIALCLGSVVFLSTGAIVTERTALEPILVTVVGLESVAFADIAFPLAVLVLSVVDLHTLVVLDDE
ncbi:hypothetical protein OB955_19700 [Halobacteria archaeon AArc-m2/3/4]|uniref:Uncharacterized protein n=1 Tax=Natronoglomus mannanivorans TaxID=2979990 RepID=A0AAP2Z502_9EURY|nr:hypothetical protein [Halobacteria archaeon AArc-xg1-1]MCU4974948.1 hypothetical protein [Halobacteria archaeon AArc-m2/3/4]